MTNEFQVENIARMAAADDNVAIAIHTIDPGSRVHSGDEHWLIPHIILEGHRFATEPIRQGEKLLSWGLPFGRAERDIEPGDYICNERMLEALPAMGVEAGLPEQANFTDSRIDFQLNEHEFTPGQQVEQYEDQATFEGTLRPGSRGVGTRNYIVVLGASSRVSAFARVIAERFRDVGAGFPNIDGVVPVAHTEGGMADSPHNLDRVLPTLAGFFVHPNVAAVLSIDYGTEAITNQVLRSYMESRGDRLDHVPHAFLSLCDLREDPVEAAARIISSWLPEANACGKANHPLSNLKVALQCGGSDGFSGISANPLVGWVSREIIRHGGSACIAETTELIGAEPYMLKNVRDLDTGKFFLRSIENFRELAGRHGHTPEGNPSGGNRFRGLYNIVVKSIGAALKKDPSVRLDYGIPYSARMSRPGFYFMDSPGNDLESIAGQVAGGSNLIFFTTGNGSITNFPFVPTIKIVTTTGRYQMLQNEMDVNAGTYLDGEPMDQLGRETFQRTISVAGGVRTAGEKAGHCQVQIWRNWQQDGTHLPEEIESGETFSGRPVPTRGGPTVEIHWPVRRKGVGLIMPNSLCSGQVANLMAAKLEEGREKDEEGVSRFVALPHTEGCGCHAADSGDLAARTLLNYVQHPSVNSGIFLEHGCEKYQNRFFQDLLSRSNVPADRYGWASIQKDGGIRKASERVASWFEQDSLDRDGRMALPIVAVFSSISVPPSMAETVATACRSVLAAGGSVVAPATSSLLASPAFVRNLLNSGNPAATLAYGCVPGAPGFHVMDVPTDDELDVIGGLGATGAETILACVDRHPVQAHPFIPIIQVSSCPESQGDDIDLILPADVDPIVIASNVLNLMLRAIGGEYVPRMLDRGLTAFQLSRGRLGISL